MAFWKVSVELMMNGASGDVLGIRDDEPMCMHNTVPVSSQARNTGAQLSDASWMEGSPSGYGFSGKVMAKLPLSAQRWISAGGQLGVPQRHHGERDQRALAGAGGPLVDHPVVVGLHAQEGELLVLALEEGLPAEAGERVREVDGRLDVVGRHVGQPGRLVPGALADFVEGRQAEPELLEADRGRHHHEGGDQVVVVPDVAPLPVGRLGPAQPRSGAALGAAQHLHLLAFDAWSAVLVAGRQARGPQVWRLDDVIVDGDDQRWLCHGQTMVAAPRIGRTPPGTPSRPPAGPRRVRPTG